MKEKTFENQVKAYLKDNGCWVLKTWSNGIQRKGVPDLLVCCNGYFIGIELKNEVGKATELQKWNVEQIRKAGGISIILHPNKFDILKDLIRDLNLQVGSDHDWWYKHQSFLEKE